MDKQELLSIIKQTKEENRTVLYLSHKNITELPPEIGQLTNLRRLNLFNNQLIQLPNCIGQLTNLKTLNLAFNQLPELPDCIGQLTNLQTLDLYKNQLTELPDCIGQLTKLQALNLGNNQLTKLPDCIGQQTNLQTLYIGDNQLTELPDCIGQLTNLQELHIGDNQLTELPDCIGQLTNLRRLEISLNQLTELPNWIGQLTNLQKLYLSGNRLIRLPQEIGKLKNLTMLISDNNNLKNLPSELQDLKKLTQLFLHGNEQLGLPLEVLGPTRQEVYRSVYIEESKKKPAKPAEILAWYFKSQHEPRRRLNEAKMLIVGQGGVGKTSLVDYLINKKPCKPDELPTEGININDWDISGKKGTNSKMERIGVHVWDFGGQEIMHATHQFFLTRRSLYLLVIDARAGEKESNIHYWLKIIQSYANDSPVLVVLNKCDQHPHELNETRLRQDYPNIRGFIQTSCTTGHGIAELRREIRKQIRRLPHVYDELPASYFTIKTELEKIASEKNYIPIDDYRKLCRRYKVNKKDDQNKLIRFLHDLGVVLNFQDPKDPFGQDDQFVLDPEWVTEGVYAILNDAKLKQRKDGILTLDDRERILKTAKPTNKRIAEKAKKCECFPVERHGFIMDKMCQFELAYELYRSKGTQSWLIPELLDPNEPASIDWAQQTSLNFRYDYPVLPAGVICRFIVRMQHYVQHKKSWRSGTVLNIDGSKVLVRGDTDNNKVYIAIQGTIEPRRERLAIVRDAFNYIHSTIPALKPKEMVPLPDMPNVAISYSHLLKLEKNGQREHYPEGADKPYMVKELLNGVDSAYYRLKRRPEKIRKRLEMNEKHVFISYCHDNKNEVAQLVEYLEDAGIHVWWDEDILGGQDWKHSIREAMENSYAFVLCLSPQLTQERYSSGVYPEIHDAIATLRQYGPGFSYIFPVRLADCQIPAIEIDDTRTLKRIQYIDLFPENKRKAGLQKLIKSLESAPRDQ